MLVLLDCRPLLTERSNGEKASIIISCVKFLARERGVEWLFLVDSRYEKGHLPGISGGALLTSRRSSWLDGWKAWYDRPISRAIREYRPDLLLRTGGLPAGRWALPEYSVWTARAGGGPAVGDQVILVPEVPDEVVRALTGEEKEKVKGDYAGGKEYFLATIDGLRTENWTDLLKAFSLFKKRQQSNMQIVLVPAAPGREIRAGDKLNTYKYRADTHLYNGLSPVERARLLAGSYAFLPLSNTETTVLPLLNAWKAGIPVIAPADGLLSGTGGEAVLYVQGKDPASLAAQMMLIYKDERLRAGLVEKGQEQVQAFTVERSAGQVWEAIERAVRGFLKSAINK